MHLHILGIAGTFMGGLAQLAKASGHQVTGADKQVYPPMSHQLEAAGIGFVEGFDPSQLEQKVDQIVVGNVMTRGQPLIESMLNQGRRYTSGPQWLYENILADRWVLAVSGTHGKTTTASMLAWILEDAGMSPGFLIGGVPSNFGVSARLGETPFFVIEADEYDTAFFDKRSKFVHYHPRTLIVNNLEFDHADIFPDLAAIQRQFHHLMRMVPGDGRVICPQGVPAVAQMLEMGCWTPVEALGNTPDQQDWGVRAEVEDGSSLTVFFQGAEQGRLNWSMLGQHNASNALAAIAAARHVGVSPAQAIDALSRFKGVKRRMETRAVIHDIYVYDDFAHHPTAVRLTLEGLRKKVGQARILVAFEPRSNTMRMGVHAETLAPAFAEADQVFAYHAADLGWALQDLNWTVPLHLADTVASLCDQLVAQSQPGDHILVMSNGGFGGLHEMLATALQERFSS
ncbi:MAG TPA: UDP-N-acetylmuramate:L-alanyl-gamma-D-glutamyl-meso-diaminopimelate ligase [Gammaproteobacteria bacterium]|nr:UDP-N-acetylmuramate:L-alanyl-gamma-D-glutamyl-meso-diaminopimelate ligase [Gammaproteobacteria bacterium]